MPCDPPAKPMSALTSPLWVPVLSMTSVVPDQISTQPVEFDGLPTRVTGLRRVDPASGATLSQLLGGFVGIA